MHRNMLAGPKTPYEIFIREHDYSIRIIKTSSDVEKRSLKYNKSGSKFNRDYELKELLIEVSY